MENSVSSDSLLIANYLDPVKGYTCMYETLDFTAGLVPLMRLSVWESITGINKYKPVWIEYE